MGGSSSFVGVSCLSLDMIVVIKTKHRKIREENRNNNKSHEGFIIWFVCNSKV
jgi:hypothetical protein